jgi:hypothetical protein
VTSNSSPSKVGCSSTNAGEFEVVVRQSKTESIGASEYLMLLWEFEVMVSTLNFPPKGWPDDRLTSESMALSRTLNS